MSQNDWQSFLHASRTFIGTTGSIGQHNLLSNPITSSGDWYRAFYPSENNYSSIALMPINNSQLTSSSGYPYGYSYSIRCWYRATSNNIYVGASLIFKGNNTISGEQHGGNKYEAGYTLNASAQSLNLICRRNEGEPGTSDTLDPANPNFSYVFQKDNIQTSPLTANLWHRIRMDIVPISGAYDRITIYTGSQNNTWHQQYTVDISQLKTYAYIPWANNPNGDGASAAGKGYLGIKVFTSGFGSPVFIDQFEVYKQLITI